MYIYALRSRRIREKLHKIKNEFIEIQIHSN